MAETDSHRLFIFDVLCLSMVYMNVIMDYIFPAVIS